MWPDFCPNRVFTADVWHKDEGIRLFLCPGHEVTHHICLCCILAVMSLRTAAPSRSESEPIRECFELFIMNKYLMRNTELHEHVDCDDRKLSPGGSREKLLVVASSGFLGELFVKGRIHLIFCLFLLKIKRSNVTNCKNTTFIWSATVLTVLVLLTETLRRLSVRQVCDQKH